MGALLMERSQLEPHRSHLVQCRSVVSLELATEFVRML